LPVMTSCRGHLFSPVTAAASGFRPAALPPGAPELTGDHSPDVLVRITGAHEANAVPYA
jgi:hypothetical protein